MSQTSTPQPDHPGVIGFPPLIFGLPWLAGLGLHLVFPEPVLPDRAAHVSGAGLIVLAVALAVWGRRAMARADTDPNPMHPATALVVDGPFRYSRNPLYVSLTVFYVGLALALNTLWPLVLLPFVAIVIERGVVEREERYLERKFGEAYREYRGRVRRWV